MSTHQPTHLVVDEPTHPPTHPPTSSSLFFWHPHKKAVRRDRDLGPEPFPLYSPAPLHHRGHSTYSSQPTHPPTLPPTYSPTHPSQYSWNIDAYKSRYARFQASSTIKVSGSSGWAVEFWIGRWVGGWVGGWLGAGYMHIYFPCRFIPSTHPPTFLYLQPKPRASTYRTSTSPVGKSS